MDDYIVYVQGKRKVASRRQVERFYEKRVIHRINGPAVFDKEGVYKAWIVNGKKHRTDGPAVVSDHCKEYWVNGKKHNLDGPARIWFDDTAEYWINGVELTCDNFDKVVKWMK